MVTFPPVEARVARLEASVEHIERDIAEMKIDGRSTLQAIDHLRGRIDYLRDRVEGDFRITWAGIMALGLGLAGLMAKGFGWL